MTQLISSVGSFAPGILFQENNGIFSSVPSGSAGSYLVSTGNNTYKFSKNFAQSNLSFGVIQSQLVTIGGNITVGILNPPPTGSPTSLYDPAAVLLSTTFSNASPFSVIYIESCVTGTIDNANALITLYAGAPVLNTPITSSFIGSAYTTGYTASALQVNFFGGPIGTVVPILIAVCGFWQFNNTCNIGMPSDYLLVQELVPIGTTNVSTVTATVSNTPTLFISISTSAMTSYFVIGTVGCGDTAFSNSNTFSFMFLVQQGSGTTPTITVGPTSGLSAYPFLSYTVSSGVANVYLNGNGIQTFNCTATYTITQGNAGL